MSRTQPKHYYDSAQESANTSGQTRWAVIDYAGVWRVRSCPRPGDIIQSVQHPDGKSLCGPEEAPRPLRLGDMTDAQFEAWLKANRLSGLGAAAAGRKRRRQQMAEYREKQDRANRSAT